MSKRIPSYREHKPSGQAVVTLSGKDHYLGPWQSEVSRAEYDRLVAEWLTSGRQFVSSFDEITVVELIAKYLEFAKVYYANDGETTSEYTCMRDSVRPLRKLYGRKLASEFGPKGLKAVRQEMIDRGWCRPHINQQINRIRRVFKWGIENELVEPRVLEALRAVSPLKKGRTDAREPDPVRSVSDEHVNAVLPFVSGQVAAMIELQRLTGMRPGEVVQIRPCDIDRSASVWVYRPERHKTKYRGRSREIFLGPEAQDILRPWLVRAADSHCFRPEEAYEEWLALRRTSDDQSSPQKAKKKTKRKHPFRPCYNVNAYRSAIGYGIKKAGVPKWTPNQLRHSYATRIRAEFGLDVAQLLLGHAHADVTQVYAEVDQTRAIEAVKRVG